MSEPASVDIPQLWVQRARSDLLLAQVALVTPGVLCEDACFHAQQCAEKALKGLLSQMSIPFPRTHAIDLLLDLLTGAGVEVPEPVDEAFALTQ